MGGGNVAGVGDKAVGFLLLGSVSVFECLLEDVRFVVAGVVDIVVNVVVDSDVALVGLPVDVDS